MGTEGKVVTLEQKQSVLSTFNANPSGCFIGVQGYVNSKGEVANYTLQAGVNYWNIKQSSVEMLNDLMVGKGARSVHVKCNVWENPDGSWSNRKGKDRTFETFEREFAFDSEPFQEACKTLIQNITKPRANSNTYEKESKSLYSLDEETLYIRDCLKVTKRVTTGIEYPAKATMPSNALKNAIKELLPISNYRTFKLEQFDSITINGSIII